MNETLSLSLSYLLHQPSSAVTHLSSSPLLLKAVVCYYQMIWFIWSGKFLKFVIYLLFFKDTTPLTNALNSHDFDHP